MQGTNHTEKYDGQLFVVSGPSGSGKSTLCRNVLQNTDVCISISATTRPRGVNEVDGKDYFFMTEEEFVRKIEAGEFLEHARVFDHYYGTPAQSVCQMLKEGKKVILEIDIQGAGQIFEKFPDAIGIFILPPSDKDLECRLSNRGRDDRATIDKRLAQAHWEIEQAKKNDRYKYVVINDDLQNATEEMTRIIG